MELRTVGKKNLPPVLFMPGDDCDRRAAEAALRALKREYRLLIPDFEEGDGPDALAEALLRDRAEALWGAYGLNDGAEELLALLDRDALEIRTRVVEGRFTLPGEAPPAGDGRIRCWTGYRDKEGKRSLEALRSQGWQAASLTLKKLPRGKSFLSYCPGAAAAQLKKAFGAAVSVRRSAVLPAGMERVWRLLGESPEAEEAARLDRAEPLRRDEEKRTLLYQGSGAGLPVWFHLIRLEAEDPRRTRCTDLVFFRAAAGSPVTKRAVSSYLLRLHILRLLALLRSGHAL